MAHTPLLGRVGSAAALAREAQLSGQDVDSVLEEHGKLRQSRRDFLRRATLAGSAALVAPGLYAKKPLPTPPTVAVVGAGLAGLTCAYRLKQAGVFATVFEANTRLGGRCWTRRGDFEQGQIAEHGGELIDQSHARVRNLAQELRLKLDNLLAAEPNGTEAFFYFGGERYPYREAVTDLKAIWQRLHRDLSDAGYPTLYNRFTARGAELDQMSIIDWINDAVPGGIQSRLGKLLDVAYNIEYGAECERQSALNLLYLLGYNSPGQFTLFGASNEKYHVRGGNDQIAASLASAVNSQIVTEAALAAVHKTPAGRYQLTFQTGSGTEEVIVDKVILALPFSILRSAVDYSGAGFSALKTLAIEQLAMGTNSKLNVQFTGRPWHGLGNNGETYADTGYQATWEVTRAQRGSTGILVDYTGGDVGDSFGSGTPAQRAAQFLAQVEPILPGLTSAWNGKATVDYWPGNPFTRGSYSFWQVGQYTTFAGVEGEREGNAHFCGEHTSIDAQGYLEGAVESGERAASEVLAG